MPSILVVEDSDDLRALYDIALKNNGFDTILAPNGKVGLEMARAANPKPDFIILDLMMPVMDGKEFLQHRSADPQLSEIPVVVCSAAKSDLPEQLPFMQKPVDLGKLLDMVQAHCISIEG